MAYLSEIDLKTLHKKRLDEKNLYQLSMFNNRRFYDDEIDQHHYHPMIARNNIQQRHNNDNKNENVKLRNAATITSNVGNKTKSSENISKGIVKTSSNGNARVANDGNNNCTNNSTSKKTLETASKSIDINSNHRTPHQDYYDEGYFSSPTLSRRRSGTWP